MNARRVALVLLVVVCAAGTAAGQTIWVDDPAFHGLEPGPPGSWDEGGCWPLAVAFDGLIYHLWYEGFSATWQWQDVGHATSIDRVHWTKDGDNPVLTRGGAPGGWDDDGIAGAAVIWDGALFHMWYGGVYSDGIERACYATSPDGREWTKLVCSLPGLEPGVPNQWDQNTVRPTTVIVEGDIYRMWYGGVEQLGGGLGWSGKVGYAESPDGISWTKHPDPIFEPREDTWEEMQTVAPYVIFNGSGYHMFYSGGRESYPSIVRHSIGYAFSPNGITNWTRSTDNPVIQMTEGFAFSSPVLLDGAIWHMWYSHSDGAPPLLISHATSMCCAGIFGDDFETGDTQFWSTTVP